MSDGPVLIGYDGSQLAADAIAAAGRVLGAGQEAVVLCVWQPADVGFDAGGQRFDTGDAQAVQKAAENVAAHGAELAAQAGFHASAETVEAVPTYTGIIETAEKLGASLLVLGPHHRTGLGHLLGSVTKAVFEHTDVPLLVVRGR